MELEYSVNVFLKVFFQKSFDHWFKAKTIGYDAGHHSGHKSRYKFIYG